MADTYDTDALYNEATKGSTDDLYNQALGSTPQTMTSMIQDKLFDSGPYPGELADLHFSDTNLGRIVSAFGQGAHDSWGANGGSIYEDEIKWEAQHKDQDKSIVYGLHTSWMRPLAAAIDAAVKIPFALTGGIGGAIGQTGQELTDVYETSQEQTGHSLVNDILAFPFGYAGEFLRGVSAGAIPTEGIHVPDYIQQVSEARAKGIIGEGEPGFYGTVKPNPEQIQARINAAHSAGYGPPTLEEWLGPKTVPTERELARQIAPETFQELDRLQELKENSSASAQYLMANRTAELDREEHALLGSVGGDEGQLPAALQKRLQNIRGLREEAAKTPTEGELQMRNQALQADIGLRDMIPDIRDAEQRVQKLLNAQGPEADAYRDYVQRQAFERAIQIENLRPQVQKAYRDASELIPPQEPTVAPGKPAEGVSAPAGIGTAPEGKTPSAASRILQVEGITPGVKETGTANRLEEEAVQKGFADYLPDKSLYDPTSYNEQGKRAVQYVKQKYDEAVKVVSGKTEGPSDIHPVAVFNALKQEAYKRGDLKAITELARSPLNRRLSEAGQTLGLARGLFDNLDAADIIKSVEDSWIDRGQKSLDKAVNAAREYAAKAVQNLTPDYEGFLKNIECDY